MQYDLLVIDLDGTLLRRDGSVSEANVAAVERARIAGLEIIIATGRAHAESLAPLEAIQHFGLVVAAGGSLMTDAATGRTLARSVMPHDLVEEVCHALTRHGHKVLLLKDADETGYDYLAVGTAELDPASVWWFKTLPVRVRFARVIDVDPHPASTVRIGAVAGGADLAPLAEHLREEVGDRCFLQHWSAVTATAAVGSATHLLEIFNPGVSKWTMIAAHCESRGIAPDRVAAIGDGLNDVQIVREAQLGIAMANADPRVLEVADRVTADHDEDGVALAIDRILAGHW